MTRVPAHVPVRLCAGCGRRDAKTSMDRFTLVEGSLVWERGRGRGGYLHREESCRRAFVGRKRFLRSLRNPVARAERARLVSLKS